MQGFLGQEVDRRKKIVMVQVDMNSYKVACRFSALCCHAACCQFRMMQYAVLPTFKQPWQGSITGRPDPTPLVCPPPQRRERALRTPFTPTV